MKIFLFGKSGSGKSTILTKLNAHLNYQALIIDEYRTKHGDYTWQGYNRASSYFLDDIATDQTNQIIECSGLGKLGEAIRNRMLKINDKIIVLIIVARSSVCMSRNQGKAWYAMKMPYQSVKDINRTIRSRDTYDQLRAWYHRYTPLSLLNNNQYEHEETMNKIFSIVI